jgi:hypothetical protein
MMRVRCSLPLGIWLYSFQLLIHVASAQTVEKFDSSLWPDKCHGLARSDVYFDQAKFHAIDKGKYDEVSLGMKRDVVCVGDQIIIDSPVYTNGGDIFIFANKIVITQPIDTRIFRPFKLENLFAEPIPGTDCEPGGFRDSCRNTLGLLRSGRQEFTKAIRAAFLDYYDCNGCRQIGDKKYVARMPDGLVPAMNPAGPHPHERPGFPPPDDRVNAQEEVVPVV